VVCRPAARAAPGTASLISTMPSRCVPFDPTYATLNSMLLESRCSMVKFHCCAYGTRAGICVACSARGAVMVLIEPPATLENDALEYVGLCTNGGLAKMFCS